VSVDERHWFLLNAAPDLRQQIADTPILHPRDGLRSSPIAGVVLTGGDVDVIAGLLTLRERQPLTVYGTSKVLDVLDANPIFEVLARDIVPRRRVPLDSTIALAPGLDLTLFPVPGKTPLYLETDDAPPIVEGEETVGAALSDGTHTLFYIPGCAAITESLRARLRGAHTLFFDGTLFTDDEMIRAGLGPKTGRRMGHLSVETTMEGLADLGIARKIFIHINNSNPILLADSPERGQVEAAGWQVAEDGMQVML